MLAASPAAAIGDGRFGLAARVARPRAAHDRPIAEASGPLPLYRRQGRDRRAPPSRLVLLPAHFVSMLSPAASRTACSRLRIERYRPVAHGSSRQACRSEHVRTHTFPSARLVRAVPHAGVASLQACAVLYAADRSRQRRAGGRIRCQHRPNCSSKPARLGIVPRRGSLARSLGEGLTQTRHALQDATLLSLLMATREICPPSAKIHLENPHVYLARFGGIRGSWRPGWGQMLASWSCTLLIFACC